jgi:protoheme IX farnesyltransferase
MLRNYYNLVKPGIIFGNTIPYIGGFAIAAGSALFVHALTGVAGLIGLALVVASGCVFNNYIDRDIDGLMDRTKNRALPKGIISPRNAFIYGIILGVFGILVLFLFTNALTAAVALGGWFVYVVIYSLWAKRWTSYATLIGSVAGAVPPVVGYCALSGRLDGTAAVLFLIMAIWQIPHFYSIAMYRSNDYAAARIPVLPLVRGIWLTKVNMTFCIVAFTGVAALLAMWSNVGIWYVVIALLLGSVWFIICLNGFWVKNEERWARRMFTTSLVVLVVLFLSMTVGSILS